MQLVLLKQGVSRNLSHPDLFVKNTSNSFIKRNDVLMNRIMALVFKYG